MREKLNCSKPHSYSSSVMSQKKSLSTTPPKMSSPCRFFSRVSINTNKFRKRFALRLSSTATTEYLVHLTGRSLFEITGEDGPRFLQGLVTCDVVNPTRLAQYSMLLNIQGRVLYDIIVYHVGRGRLWVESDRGASDTILRHLKKYVLRAKVSFRQLNDVFVYSKIYGSNALDIDCIVKIEDPRTRLLGDRVLTDYHIDCTSKEIDYHKLRMEQGVPEGTTELPPGQCLPLEMNLDYMNGVSFNKGCYLGQELTSRTHHTGVVRKRVLPLTINDKSSQSSFVWGNIVNSLSGKSIGKILGYYDSHAVALLRLANLVEGESVNIVTGDGLNVSSDWKRPEWWPSERTDKTIT